MNLFTKRKQTHRHRKQTYGSLSSENFFVSTSGMKTKKAIALWWLRVRARIRVQDLRKGPLTGPALGCTTPRATVP